MDDTKATETIVPTIAPEEKVEAPTDEAEARIAALEAEKAKILEEKENYRKAYLKEAERAFEENPEEEKMAEVARKVLADSRIAEIAREQEAIIKKALKENKELKLAQMNKPTFTPTGGGSSPMSAPVRDTTVSSDQMAYFKSRNWSDKDIERYKRNLQKNTR